MGAHQQTEQGAHHPPAPTTCSPEAGALFWAQLRPALTSHCHPGHSPTEPAEKEMCLDTEGGRTGRERLPEAAQPLRMKRRRPGGAGAVLEPPHAERCCGPFKRPSRRSAPAAPHRSSPAASRSAGTTLPVSPRRPEQPLSPRYRPPPPSSRRPPHLPC